MFLTCVCVLMRVEGMTHEERYAGDGFEEGWREMGIG